MKTEKTYTPLVGTRKAKLAAFNRAGILETANLLFLKNGVAGTTMDEIAKTAEYSKTTLYAYFKSKEDIFNHLILEGMEHLLTKVRQIADKNNNFKAFYFDFCHELIAMHDANQIYFEGMAGKILCSIEDTEKDETLKKIYIVGEEISTAVEGRVLMAAAKGEIEATAVMKETMTALWFYLIGVIEKASNKEGYILRNLGKTRDEFLQFALTMLLQLIAKGKNT